MEAGSKKRVRSETKLLEDTLIDTVLKMIDADDFSAPEDAGSTALRDHFSALSTEDRLPFCFLLFAISEQHAGDLSQDINLSSQLGKLGIQCQATIAVITRGIKAWYSKPFQEGGDMGFHHRAQEFFKTARRVQEYHKRIAVDKHAKSVQGLSIAKIDGHAVQEGRTVPDKLVLCLIGTEKNVDDTARQSKEEEHAKSFVQRAAPMLRKFPEIGNIERSLVHIDGQPVLVILRQHDGKDDDHGAYLQPTLHEDVDNKQAAGVIMRSGCTTGMQLRVTLWNLGECLINLTPAYVDFNGTNQREELVDLASGEQFELPFALERSEGEEKFGWDIHDATDSVALRIEFTGEEVTGVESMSSEWHMDLAQAMLNCKKGEKDATGKMSRVLQVMDVVFATARGPQSKGGSTRSATGSAPEAAENDVMSVRVFTAKELLENKIDLRYVRVTDVGVDESDAVSFRPGETHLDGELRGGSSYRLQMAVRCAEATVQAVAVESHVYRALVSVEEGTRALALQAMRQFPQTFLNGVWETVPVLCGLKTSDVYNAGSLSNDSCLVHGRDLTKYRCDISYTLQSMRKFAKRVELRPDGGAVIVEAAAREMRAVVGQVVLYQRSSMEPNVTGEAFCPLPSLNMAKSVEVKECKAVVGDVCAICMENLVGSVTLIGCSNGHVVCGQCGVHACKKLYLCPLCREVLDPSKQTVVPLMEVPENSGV